MTLRVVWARTSMTHDSLLVFVIPSVVINNEGVSDGTKAQKDRY